MPHRLPPDAWRDVQEWIERHVAFNRYPLITGGKPIVSMPTFIVIAFELTILFGALGTLLGLLVIARSPRLRIGPAFDPRFCEDQFGLFVFCTPDQLAFTSHILREAGAVEVRHVEE